VLLGGVNDSVACADALADLAHQVRCNVNLIRYNATRVGSFHPPSPPAVQAFAERLDRRGVNVHVRQSRGADADAACGQLRLRAETP
jgi:23S rRNA (adenine2503-C2)-methyltransferase